MIHYNTPHLYLSAFLDAKARGGEKRFPKNALHFFHQDTIHFEGVTLKKWMGHAGKKVVLPNFVISKPRKKRGEQEQGSQKNGGEKKK